MTVKLFLILYFISVCILPQNSSSPECVLIPPNTKFFDLKNFNNFLDLILLSLIDLFSENFKFPKFLMFLDPSFFKKNIVSLF